MAIRETRVRCHLADYAQLGVHFWMTKSGWYWLQLGKPWVLGGPAPAHGPFETAPAAGDHCAATLGLKQTQTGAQWFPGGLVATVREDEADAA